jgi:NADH:ubiquinone oxidoreductase subunit 6 (subunit J)
LRSDLLTSICFWRQSFFSFTIDKQKKFVCLLFIFSSLALVSGIMVIQSRNPVHSVLFLILVFFNAAGLLILLGLDFFAMIFLVVYIGAIAVLFLFVVMMLNIKLAEINEKKLRYLPIGGLLGILFLFEIFLIVDNVKNLFRACFLAS